VRVKAVIAYDGTQFYGFQRQKSTQNTVEESVEKVLHSLGIEGKIRGSGRTDRGVHASGQVIDFQVPPFWEDLEHLKEILNRKLKYIQFKKISPVDENFHARFSAERRVYRYIFKTSSPSLFERRYISHYSKFDINLLNKSLQLFEGKHDFGFFRKSGTSTHTDVRTIYRAYYKKYRNCHIIYFEANGFLRSQVRLMVEFSMGVALKKFTLTQQLEQLNLQHRYGSRLAPPEGLYLARVVY
jgi:tRNA pseudouridine38-40 synthase